MRLNKLVAAMGLVSTLSVSHSILASPVVLLSPGVQHYNWEGVFIMLSPDGAALANTSIPYKGNNQFNTPVSGTLAFDPSTGTGTATLLPFEFFHGTLPFESVDINLQTIGDGMGGAGTLMLGNMLFNWNGYNGMPSSSVFDAAGLLANELSAGGISSAVPASDGTYVGSWIPDTSIGPGGYPGYLGIGPVPIATTAWNTTNVPGCAPAADSDYSNNIGGGCLGINPSGTLPTIFDPVNNIYDETANTGGGIGGSPILDGPFYEFNININFEKLEPVPVPAAVWLFGSGLFALIGLARRKQNHI